MGFGKPRESATTDMAFIGTGFGLAFDRRFERLLPLRVAIPSAVGAMGHGESLSATSAVTRPSGVRAAGVG